MVDVDGSSLFGEDLLWMKFNGIIERFSRTYITMGRYLHIIRCITIELFTYVKMKTVRRSFTVVIAFPQLKCASNERGSIQNSSLTQPGGMSTRLLLKLAGPVPS